MCSYRPEFELRRVKFMFATGPAVKQPPPFFPQCIPMRSGPNWLCRLRFGNAEVRASADGGRDDEHTPYTALLRLKSDGATVTRGWSGKAVS